jgi:hypothetical protein
MFAGTTCSPNPCAFGACCGSGGACTLQTAILCFPNRFVGGNTCTPDNPCNAYLGNCCTGTACTVTTAPGCGSGMFQGVTGTYVSGNSCSSSTFCQSSSIVGACCTSAGVCSITTFNSCNGTSTFLGNGVNYPGSGTACTSTTYCTTDATSLLGTCCGTGGACTVTTSLGCTGSSTFSFVGATAACASAVAGAATNPCTVTLGGCCSATGACTVTTAAGCSSVNSSFQTSVFLGASVYPGSGTTCTGTPCQNSTYMGSCCSASGACSITTMVGCLATATNVFQGLGTNYSGSGTACTSTTFCQTTSNLGACCSGGGTCTTTTASGCLFPFTFAGVGVGYAGGSTTCSPTTYCNTALGSCCSSGGGCTITNANGCLGTSVFLGAGVNYSGSGTSCTSTTYCNGGQAGAAVGACCAGTTCSVTSQAGCAITSTWLGANVGVTGTACNTTPAPCQSAAVVGACCSATGSCSLVATVAACPAPSVFAGLGNGYSTGTGTSCSPTDFCTNPQTLGSCCSSSGTCSATTAAGCTGNNFWQGAGVNVATSSTACTSTTYCQSGAIMGACCSATGACSATTAAGCGGTNSFAGVGNGYTTGTSCSSSTYCTSGASDVVGACCSSTNGSCTLTRATICSAPGTFSGVGTTCSPSNPCGGACCNGATCTVVLNAGQCSFTFTNNGACSPSNVCTGACCNNDGTCTFGTAAACTTGIYQGGGTACGATVNQNVALEDISTTGTQITTLTGGTLDDGYLTNVPIGFTFTYYGVAATTCTFQTNGEISVGFSNTTTNYGATLPTSGYNGEIGAAMNDLSATATGSYWYQTKGSAPSRRFIVEWLNVPHFNTTTPTNTFEIILYETSNLIEFRYGSMGITATTVYTAVQSPDGTQAMNIGTFPASNTSVYVVPTAGGCAGACCAGTSCSAGTKASCLVGGGIYQGNNSSCSPNPCNTGACCNLDGSCTNNVNGGGCTTSGGFYQGNLSTCGAVACPMSGVCCTSTSCTIAFQANCSGAFTAGGTSCTPNNCAQACCDGITGACSLVATGSSCSGTALAAGSTCSPTDPCGPYRFACCDASTGACTLLGSAATCSGLAQAAGTTCSPTDSCAAVRGSCCNTSTATCTVTTTAGCSFTYAGNGTTCTSNPCPPPPNDTCTGAIMLTIGTTFSGSNSAALSGNDGTDSTCGTGHNNNGLWFTFTTSANPNSFYRVDFCGSNFDTYETVYSGGSCSGGVFTGTQVACNDDYGNTTSNGVVCSGGSTLASGVQGMALSPSTLYYVRLASYTAGSTGNFNVLVTEQMPVGVCCNNTTGVCTGIFSGACPTGTTAAAGTACSPSPCSSIGICCNTSSGACSQLFGGTCASGTVAGTGTTCVANSCPATGICCNTTSCACTVVYSGSACATGTTAGTGTSCTASSCPGIGVCCDNTTGACTTLCSGTCPTTATQGTGTTCGGTACPGTGACCIAYGSPDTCATFLGSTCTARGGLYLGDNSTCSVGGCLPSRACDGACAAGSMCASNNGGFESGTLTGSWTNTDTTFTVVENGVAGPGGQTPHSGNSFLSTGPTTTPASTGISQTITANPGDIATITFWYETQPSPTTANEIKVVFDGVTLMDLVGDLTHTTWSQFTFTATVSNPNPTLSFLTYNGPSYDALDDISVCVAPGIGACCETNTGLCTSVSQASCGAGHTFLGGACSPNPCPPPPGVCCRGATCNAGITVAANCVVTAGSAAGAFFATPFTACNAAGNTTTPCCYADYDKMNGIQVADIFAMLNDWFAGKKYAIAGGDGAHGTLSVQNIFDFLNLWFAGGC